jgi:hypothetical protein
MRGWPTGVGGTFSAGIQPADSWWIDTWAAPQAKIARAFGPQDRCGCELEGLRPTHRDAMDGAPGKGVKQVLRLRRANARLRSR